MTQYSNFARRNQRNVFFNGNFYSWPDGLTGPFTGSHTAAMTLHGYSTTGMLTPSGTSATKPNDNCNYVHCVTTNLAQASLTGTNHTHVLIRVEGYDFVPFIGNSATLSFWVRATVTGTYSIAFRNDNAVDRCYVTEYTINQSNTWEYKTIHVTFDYSGGNWNYINGIGLQVSFTQAVGTTYATSTTDEWVTGNYIASTNQVNNIATVGNTFYLSQCQLELGDTATEFEHLDVAITERLLKRYYQYVWLYHTMGGQIGTGAGNCYFGWKFMYPMRANPTVTVVSPSMWNPNNGWRTPTSQNLGNTQTSRAMHIFGDSTYTGNQNNWALLQYGGMTLDARI